MRSIFGRMRRAVGSALIAAASSACAASVARAQPAAYPQEVRDTVHRYVAAWDGHDAVALADFFAEDADMIMGNSPILTGRPAIQGWWRRYFAVQEPARRLTIEVEYGRAISTDVVLLNVRTTTGGRTARGTELQARKARGTWLLVRRKDEWLISAMRGMPTEQDRIVRSHEQPSR